MNIKGILFFVPEHLREEIEGDLLQRFERDVQRKGHPRAKLHLAWNIIRFFRPGILFRKNNNKKPIPVFMLKNYFVIAIRNMMAHKMSSSINILSLIIGITSALVMMSVIQYELSFDKFHTNASRIYRIVRTNETGWDSRGSGIAYPVTDVFRDEVSAIEKITGVQYYGGGQIDVDLHGTVKKMIETKGFAFVDQEFFNVFDFNNTGFKWISGNPQTALAEPFSVVITESLAKKYFGDTDPLGKTILLEGQLESKITGVVSDLPGNTDLPFTLMVSYSTLNLIEGEERMKDDWNSINANQQAFVLVPPGTSVEEVEAQFDKVHALHVNKDMANTRKYRLQALTNLHKDAKLQNFNGRTVDETALLIMAITGLLLLSVGCINSINITTAQSTMRSKEIGVRKVLGGQRKQLILQFLSETFVLGMIASVLSLLLAEIILVNAGSLTNTVLQQHLILDPFILAMLGILVVSVTLIAGLYPAMVVSASVITTALKGLTGNHTNSAYLRKTLVVVQFTVTQMFLIGAFIVINQLQYSRKMDPGFDKEMIINISVPQNTTSKMNKLRAIISGIPQVSSFSISSSFPAGPHRNHWFVSVRRQETMQERETITEYQAIDTAFLNLYGIDLLQGRNFINGDSALAIVNQAVAKEIGFKNDEDAIGAPIILDGKNYKIVGVCKDFHNGSTKNKIGGMVFVYRPDFFYTSSIKLNGDLESIQNTVFALEKAWAAVYPDMVFDYTFFDESLEHYYREEKKLSTLLQIFSGVFLLLACLGLYGLLSFVINRRMKEVAVRKVFGAGINNIITLISKDYVVLILVSFAIAAPSSYYFMDQWLSGFAYHMPITWWIIVIPGAAALAIAMITLSGKLLKAASRNPAETLKHE
ncbi:MAG: ABC transporter permease [Bacteroidota bacterium]